MAEATESTTETTATETPVATTTTQTPQPTGLIGSAVAAGEAVAPTKEEPITGGTIDTTKTPEIEPTPDPNLILGKYKTQDDFIAAHKALQKDYQEETQVPETYDYEKAIDFKEYGLGWTNEEHQTTVTKELRDLGVTQKQLPGLLKLHAKSMNGMASQVGTQVDSQKELAALKQEWGDDFGTRIGALDAYRQTLDPAVVRALDNSAAGVKFLYDNMVSKRGPSFIRESQVADTTSLNTRLREILDDPLYQANGARGEAKRAEARKLAQQINPD